MDKKLTRPLWILPWSLLALAIGLIAIRSAQLVSVETARQDLQHLMSDLRKGSSNDIALLVLKADSVPDTIPFPHALAETRADARVLANYLLHISKETGSKQIDITSIGIDFRHALEDKPGNGFLWAKYALFLQSNQIEQGDVNFQYGLSRALYLGPQDYNTIKTAIEVGIRGWPRLNCELATKVMNLIEQAQRIDDHSLSRWNTELGQKLIGEHVKDLYKIHGFNPRWAKKRLSQCKESG